MQIGKAAVLVYSTIVIKIYSKIYRHLDICMRDIYCLPTC